MSSRGPRERDEACRLDRRRPEHFATRSRISQCSDSTLLFDLPTEHRVPLSLNAGHRETRASPQITTWSRRPDTNGIQSVEPYEVRCNGRR